MSYQKLNFTFIGKEYPIYFSLGRYRYLNNFAVQMLTDLEFEDAPFGTCTVNLGISLQDGYGYIDENNLPGITEWLEKNKLGTRTGSFATSGFCKYELFKFALDELRKYTKYERI